MQFSNYDFIDSKSFAGKIILTSFPGLNSNGLFEEKILAKELEIFKNNNCSSITSFVEDSEFEKLCDKTLFVKNIYEHKLHWYHLPIYDMGAPDKDFKYKWETTKVLLKNELIDGKNIVLHCRGGKGRAGTIAAILLKMAGYGFIRFSLGLFPSASEVFTPLIYTLSVIAIIFTSLIALMQEDMKKLIAYSSVAHMGFVTLGIFTIQQQGIEGSIIQMISHGLVSAALFLCVGVVYDRMHSRLIATYGGIVTIIPKYAILFMVFTLAALGLPGTSGFVGEFLILMAAFKDNFLVAVLASLGVIIGAAYMLWLYKRVIFGKLINSELKKMIDLNRSEAFTLTCLAIPTLYFGFYPEPLINTIEVSISDLIDTYNFSVASKQ